MVTFCRESALPVLAEEGLTGSLLSAKKRDAIGCYGDTSAFTEDEVGRAREEEGKKVPPRKRNGLIGKWLSGVIS